MNARRTATVLPVLTIFGIVTALALTGCSAGSEPTDAGTATVDNGSPDDTANDSDGVWDFSNNDAMSMKKSITFSINDDLFDVAADYQERRVFESITVTGVELDGPDDCAVTFDFVYADGVDTDTLVSEYIAGYPSSNLDRLGGTAGLLGFGGYGADIQFGDADLDNPNSHSIYISDDMSTATKVQDCATQPYDPEVEPISLAFSYPGPDELSGIYEKPSLASAELTVMKNGDLTVLDSRVSGFVRDSNDTWISD